MRVTLDGRNLLLPQRTGVGHYAAGLAAAISELGHKVDVVSQSPGQGRAAVWLRALRPWPMPCELGAGTRAAPDAFRAAQVHFDVYHRPLRLRGPHPPDIMHWTYPLPLHWPGVRNIYTVHDLIPLQHPALSGVAGARMRRILAAVIARASHVVTVSETTRQEVIAAFGCDPAFVTNTYQALDLPPPAADSPGPPGAYYLYAGAIEPRKNIRRLVGAYRASGVAPPLVLAGPDGWRARETTAGLLPAANVHRLGWLDRPALVRLMMGARAVLFPSLAEGFGLPVAEAMALGVPVLTSDRGALAEIAGGAALLVDPLDEGAIAGGIARLDADSTLRAELSRAGRARAAVFARDAYAGRVAAVLGAVAATPVR